MTNKGIGFWEAFRFWVKLGFINFGGPAGQIAIMHRELVERKRWISEGQYLRTLNFCMLLPGPEAQQVATYIGWRLHGTLGGIVAGSFFVIPSIFVLLLVSWLAVAHSSVPAILLNFDHRGIEKQDRSPACPFLPEREPAHLARSLGVSFLCWSVTLFAREGWFRDGVGRGFCVACLRG